MVITAKGIKVPATFTSYWKQKNNVKFILYYILILFLFSLKLYFFLGMNYACEFIFITYSEIK